MLWWHFTREMSNCSLQPSEPLAPQALVLVLLEDGHDISLLQAVRSFSWLPCRAVRVASWCHHRAPSGCHHMAPSPVLGACCSLDGLSLSSLSNWSPWLYFPLMQYSWKPGNSGTKLGFETKAITYIYTYTYTCLFLYFAAHLLTFSWLIHKTMEGLGWKGP